MVIIGKPLCEEEECFGNSEEGYDYCLGHNPKYREGFNDGRAEQKDQIIDIVEKMTTAHLDGDVIHRVDVLKAIKSL